MKYPAIFVYAIIVSLYPLKFKELRVREDSHVHLC